VIVFSARPGTVWREIKVALPRPRRLEMKRKPEFVTLVGQIWTLIETEVRASLQQAS
jgi:NitT/TauT family transport system ATP-binding protein